MNPTEDRRCPSTLRISHTALVDICNPAGTSSAFQGESSNISGRGMNVRTSFLPEIGEELVCRFNHGPREILVEGVVAWRAEGTDSGEFGIQFTALDADSADVLQTLGRKRKGASVQAAQSRSLPAADSEGEAIELEDFLDEGARVRLHIDGLGAPMKASVHERTHRKVRVGSSLEFLKLGRQLELENVSLGERRSAHIDSVNVMMNPSTRIPELVVQLRYDGISPTPAPARALADGSAEEADAAAVASEEDAARELDLGEDEAPSWEPAAEALRARLTSAMSGAGAAAQKASSVLQTFARSTTASMGKTSPRRTQSGGQSAKVMRPQTITKRRLQTTRRHSDAAPTHLRSGIHHMGLAQKRDTVRPVTSSERARSSRPLGQKRRIPAAGLFGAAFIVLLGSTFALRSVNQSRGVEQESPPAETAKKSVKQPVGQETVAKVHAQKPEPDEERGVVAEVPLFGPQAMAVKEAEPKPSGETLVQAEKRAAAAAVEDQSWDDAEPEVETTDSKPWGHGRLYLPTIHRIRLDGAATAIAGAMNADGFTVVVPGRKAMESGKSIEKRDKRIVSVLTNNNARGATVKFEFRGPVPPYRVRLRQDFVEFLISAPEESVARL